MQAFLSGCTQRVIVDNALSGSTDDVQWSGPGLRFRTSDFQVFISDIVDYCLQW